ncbi:PAAR domain-containing protein [Enterobacter hormaechei]|uniref:PAAR domain-containing protein n=1 Tax=Enterobacter cloacae complex TaxID=354276 RepID=UPI000DCD1996|nr:PAAR domain-containing protein [Enterobacter hormaechei]MBK4666436.1 PAAR domain-containing protein [Enterobacter hormaechei]RAZ53878.1 PAAR domain-containing protein [Enterobacter hormaechei subsp. xiangfangensis]WMA76269.1 PAAR domain-containing protein [Enterobacter hormaechei]WMA80974.1 PAAR domain-containing protein [Enterobacter hormaechei]HCT3534377.1 PAAR domain-containing protein [Enterobacter hormaechei]
MAKGLVLLGDKTSHGGKVISASSSITVDGKKAALVGDMVSCPVEGHGMNPVVEGSPHRTFNGRAVVVDGCKCQCGCTVISSAQNSTVG